MTDPMTNPAIEKYLKLNPLHDREQHLKVFVLISAIHLLGIKGCDRLIHKDWDAFTTKELIQALTRISYSSGAMDYFMGDGKPIAEGSQYYEQQKLVAQLIQDIQEELVIRLQG